MNARVGLAALAACVIALLATPVLGALSSSTCPSHVTNCKPEMNRCRMCHHSCKYCQHFGYVENGICGPEDCMECLPGLRLDILWDDETGRCTDQPETFLETCPGHVEGCSSHNQCKKCHPTCKYCQADDEECGLKDCMKCSDASLVLWDIFTDETGECLPKGVSVEKHELTCPESVPGCHFDNRCLSCDPSCDTCQSTDTRTGVCDETDCWTCRKGSEKHFVHADGRGKCTAPGHGQVRGEIPEKDVNIDLTNGRGKDGAKPEQRVAAEDVAWNDANTDKSSGNAGSPSATTTSSSSSSSTFLFVVIFAALGGLYFFAQKYKKEQSQSAHASTIKKN